MILDDDTSEWVHVEDATAIDSNLGIKYDMSLRDAVEVLEDARTSPQYN